MRDDSIAVDQHDAVFEALDDRLGLALFINQALDVELVVLLNRSAIWLIRARPLRETLRRAAGDKAHLRFALTDSAQALCQLSQWL